MKIAIISFSYTGNNSRLAECVARQLSAEHIKILPQNSVTFGTIAMDMIFNRTPKVHPAPDILSKYDLMLFFAPVWMGHVASPIRQYLKYLKSNQKQYAFLSISGGADGANTKLLNDLVKRTGTKPIFIVDHHIKDLLSSDTVSTRKDTSDYLINEAEVNRLSELTMKEIKKFTSP
ncbi:MAG: hypothetical protein K0R07_1742 [Sedimentibacter sp.]|nr:hypothetical protein [Sedimentibacter sp.]